MNFRDSIYSKVPNVIRIIVMPEGEKSFLFLEGGGSSNEWG